MYERILIATAGNTDPIRGCYDGPTLHIVRWHKPQKVILILTDEIADKEREYHQNETAIHLLDPDCEVELVETGVLNPHSYDDFWGFFLKISQDTSKKYPDSKIFLNITSGTPQMQTAICMVAISDPQRYIAIQVETPEHRSNSALVFQPKQDLVEEWFENDLDNEKDAPSRCIIPRLLNFRMPIVQMQILSLIRNYDYSGACSLYDEAKDNFPDLVGILLNHAKKRLNLEYKEAEALAVQSGYKDQLYPVKRSNISQLIEFFNSMKIKQFRGELNDFSMRLEILTEYLGIFILENTMKTPLKSITWTQKRMGSEIRILNQEKCLEKIPGIEEYLDSQFPNTGYDWSRPLNARSIIYIISFLAKSKSYEESVKYTSEMMKWVDLSVTVRNPAAHTITTITDKSFQTYYGKSSSSLCSSIQHILSQTFGTEAKKEAFDIYNTINDLVRNAMAKI